MKEQMPRGACYLSIWSDECTMTCTCRWNQIHFVNNSTAMYLACFWKGYMYVYQYSSYTLCITVHACPCSRFAYTSTIVHVCFTCTIMRAWFRVIVCTQSSLCNARKFLQVFAGMYPMDQSEYSVLRTAIEKLALNDSSVTVYPDSSAVLGQGWRLGFLGLLHMDVFQQRLEEVSFLHSIALIH